MPATRPPIACVGTAGWQVPPSSRLAFADAGSHLERYASRLAAVEINSSFYRPHAAPVYERWAASVPEAFRFAVKCPKAITHERKLRRTRRLLERFLGEVAGLGPKLGPILVQLPPSHVFTARHVGRFFAMLREQHSGPIVCEPRHPTWLSPTAERLLATFAVARVAADPALAPGFERPGGWTGLVYYRWHGSPRVYFSDYPRDVLERHAARLEAATVETWTIFDNTALGAAAANALSLVTDLRRAPRAGTPDRPAPENTCGEDPRTAIP
jgi:uncharacterized protein YecE (DUF72 family)